MSNLHQANQSLRLPNTRAAPAYSSMQPQRAANSAATQKLMDYQKNIQPLVDASKPLQPLVDAVDSAKNFVAQLGRIPGGAAKGILNLSYLDTPTAAGIIAKEIAPDSGIAKFLGKYADIKTDMFQAAKSDVDKWTNSWVPTPVNQASQYSAVASDAIGEALPTAAVAAATTVATGGAAAPIWVPGLVGAATSAPSAFSKDYLQNEDLGSATRTAAIEAGTEFLGGMTVGNLANNINNKALSSVVDAAGEGLEEVVSGAAQSWLAGDSYGTEQAVQDFAFGATVGAAISAPVGAVNALHGTAIEGRVQQDVNAQIEQSALADVSDVQRLILNGENSTADAVIAQDSLTALQKQVANPVNTVQTTTSIPSSIAQKYGLTPVKEGSNARPISVETRSYEGIVNPLVEGLSVPEVSAADRASVNPNAPEVVAATQNNPRALYQYAQDIYLRPGTELDSSLFTYRGQANQFYRTSQEPGSIPASGAGTSWEGSGVYSAPTPYTTDLYGPSGKLADNPYSNRGIDQTAIDVDYPVGVVLRQQAALTEDVAPLTRTDAPNDAVAQGERRVRYDDQGRGLVTEIINNPADIAATGLIFGRTGVAEAVPVQYAAAEPNAAGLYGSAVESSVQTETSPANGSLSGEVRARELENATGQYTVPDLVDYSAMSISANEGNREGLASESTSVAPSENRPSSAGIMEASRAQSPEGAKNSAAQEHPAGVQEQPGSVHSHGADVAAERSSATEPGAYTSGAGGPNRSEGSEEKLSPEEYASQIWTPVQFMETNTRNTQNEEQRRRKRSSDGIDPNTWRGTGAFGQTYETAGYRSTFGGLSSY